MVQEERIITTMVNQPKKYHHFNFEEFYNKLLEYKEKFGNLEIPQNYVDEATGYILGRLVASLRLNKKKFDSGEKVLKYHLTKEQYAALDDIGFIWVAKLGRKKLKQYNTEGKLVSILTGEIIEKRRYIHFDVDLFIEKVKAYVERTGGYENITVDPEIGRRVRRVRQAYKGSACEITLTPEMIEKLNEIGFEWESRNVDRNWFPKFLEKLKAYKQNHNGSFDGVTQDKDIGIRVNNVRRAYNGAGHTQLTAEMISQLDEIGFPWRVRYQGEWFEPFLKGLIRYKQEHNGSFVGAAQDKEISVCVKAVRRAYKGVGKNRYKLTPEMIAKLNEIGFPLVAESKDWFTPFFEELKKYKEKNGSFIGVTQDPKIGNIVTGVRSSYNNMGKRTYKLTQEMIDKLNEVGFIWEAEYGLWFEPFLEKLKEYKNRHGDFKGVATDPEIGYTVGSVRQAYKGNRKLKLTPEMINQLNEIGFPWDGRPLTEGKLLKLTAERIKTRKWFDFDLFYEELLKYKEKFGDLLVPHNYSTTVNKSSNEVKTYNLGVIVSNIRISKKKLDAGETPTNHVLTEEQYRMLNEIGFVWEAKKGWKKRRNIFDIFYQELLKYKEEFGNLLIPQNYSTLIKTSAGGFDTFSLGTFVSRVRISKKKLDAGKPTTDLIFTEEQYKKLDEIGFVWEVNRSFDFNKFYEELLMYKNQFGDLNVSVNYVSSTGYKLWNVIGNFRHHHNMLKSGKIVTVYLTTEKQNKMLDDIGFVWEAVRGRKKQEDGFEV